MSNDYFQFKKFRINQEHCAMKVTTDACLQGAWTPISPDVKDVLDIGTGTGLLSLMLAQRNENITIDAVELDSAAAMQAAENIHNSPWKSRIQVINDDVRTHVFTKKYDLIIVNPPFFNNSLLGKKEKENNARHTLLLNYEDLLRVIVDNLAPDGCVSILLPIEENKIWLRLCKAVGLYKGCQLHVQHRANVQAKRIVSFMTPVEGLIYDVTLTIKYMDDDGYTEQFRDLLADFYLEF